ncbi:hypothetical protein L2E82_09054 [Cichorium intybus]|uniref:Uncharacterized protein n=1 Tax=Cichorium intybus TaxID=13427 RepID=A0ACB9G7F3_CICIN|nr:hypothetical protein L2E82_09054 [Cichorium intybus]
MKEPLVEELDGWSPAPHSSPSRKSRLRHVSTYCVVDEDLIADKLDDCMQDVIVYYPSRDDQDSVEVIYRDMACLAPQLSYKEDSFVKFRKWWKGVNLFEKACILLPVHEK